jgi:hypothetical protein
MYFPISHQNNNRNYLTANQLRAQNENKRTFIPQLFVYVGKISYLCSIERDRKRKPLLTENRLTPHDLTD